MYVLPIMNYIFFLKGCECMYFFVTLSFGKVWTSIIIGANHRGMLSLVPTN